MFLNKSAAGFELLKIVSSSLNHLRSISKKAFLIKIRYTSWRTLIGHSMFSCQSESSKSSNILRGNLCRIGLRPHFVFYFHLPNSYWCPITIADDWIWTQVLCRREQPVSPVKSRQMSIKVAQKWFTRKRKDFDTFTKIA